MFVDASAIVAILSDEPEGAALTALLEGEPSPMTSAIAVFEAVLALCRKKRASIAEAQETVGSFIQATQIRIVPITAIEGLVALDAFSRYGKGRGHPAQLNLGDCFAYAVAKTQRTSLLFKGEDFTQTDARPASTAG